MRKLLISSLCAVMLLISGCSKKSNNNQNCSEVNVVAPASETAALKAYIDSNHIDATADARGFYYKVTEPGAGSHPTICSGVVVTYSAKLTDGTEVDKGSNVSFDLSMLILGWQEGIPKIASGGSITLYLPPSLGYGAAGAGPIPANAILVFTITLNSTY